MMNSSMFRSLSLLILGCAVGGLLASAWGHSAAYSRQEAPPANPPANQAANPPAPPTMADVQHLKDIVPPASHPMVDVAYHAVNLWFAGEKKKNWPLANYYLGETRNRLRWGEVRLNPGPKGADGKPVDMQSIFNGIDNGSLAAVKQSIDKKDSQAFEVAYKMMLEDCYSCHKTAGRPYLASHGADFGPATN